MTDPRPAWNPEEGWFEGVNSVFEFETFSKA